MHGLFHVNIFVDLDVIVKKYIHIRWSVLTYFISVDYQECLCISFDIKLYVKNVGVLKPRIDKGKKYYKHLLIYTYRLLREQILRDSKT